MWLWASVTPSFWIDVSTNYSLTKKKWIWQPSFFLSELKFSRTWSENTLFSKNSKFHKSWTFRWIPQIQSRTCLNIDLFIKKTIELDRLKFVAARVFIDIFQKIQNIIQSQSANQLRQKLYWRKGHFGFTFIPNFNSIGWAIIFEIQTLNVSKF